MELGDTDGMLSHGIGSEGGARAATVDDKLEDCEGAKTDDADGLSIIVDVVTGLEVSVDAVDPDVVLTGRAKCFSDADNNALGGTFESEDRDEGGSDWLVSFGEEMLTNEEALGDDSAV